MAAIPIRRDAGIGDTGGIGDTDGTLFRSRHAGRTRFRGRGTGWARFRMLMFLIEHMTPDVCFERQRISSCSRTPFSANPQRADRTPWP